MGDWMAQKKKEDSLPADIAVILHDLKSRKEFKGWKKAHPKHKLAHHFSDYKPGSAPVWQVGFFKNKLMTTFTLGEQFAIDEDQEIYETDSPLQELDLSSVKVSFKKALSLAEKRASEHPPFAIGQTIVILQMIDGKAVWNLTLVSEQYTFLNLKLDASSGESIKEDFASLFSMARSIKGKKLPKAG